MDNSPMIKIVIAMLTVIALAGCTTAGTDASAQPNQSVTASTVPAVTAPATPDPGGDYRGSCDYTLSSNFGGNSYDHLIGEIDMRNTGNIGTVNHARITWPQEGYPPVVAKRTVRTKPGERLTVRFHVPVSQSGNVITLLQSWQEKHGMRDGCTYKVTMVDTFGSVQS